jgi:hypothetical protein
MRQFISRMLWPLPRFLRTLADGIEAEIVDALIVASWPASDPDAVSIVCGADIILTPEMRRSVMDAVKKAQVGLR